MSWRLPLFLLLAAAAANAQVIVFESLRDGNFEIYSQNADGSNLQNLSSDPGSDRLPQWSPDGTKIAFISNRSGAQHIWTMNADGSAKTQITDPNDVRGKGFPVWAPDATQIAFLSNRDSVNTQQIHLIDADGSNERSITSEGYIAPAFISWSTDGSKIVYEATRQGDADVVVMDMTVSSFAKTNVTNNQIINDFEPAWSPDGTQIVFVSDRDGNYEIYRMQADGSGQVRLTFNPAEDRWPQWSPDGTRILFQSDRTGDTALLAMMTDGSGTAIVTTESVEGAFNSWTRDGGRVLFASDRTGDIELYAGHPAGGDAERLTSSEAPDINADGMGNFSFGAPPMVNPGGVILANLAPKVETVSPRSIVSVFGIDLGDGFAVFPTLDGEGRIDTILEETCFEIAGARSPLFAATATQLNLQVPAEAPLGPSAVTAIRDCGTLFESRSPIEMVTVEAVTPGFFIFDPVAADGVIAARFNKGNAAVAPQGRFNDQFGPSRPAMPGEIITLYGTGFGETTPAFGTGELATGAAEVVDRASVMVTFGGVPMAPEDILYVGVTPQTAGLYQLVSRVPSTAQPGDNEVVLTISGKSTPVGPIVPVMAAA